MVLESTHPSVPPRPARPLRVGLLAPPWLPVPPPAYGGTENVIDVLARALVDAGQDVVLFSTGEATCPVPRAWLHDRALGVGGSPLEEARQALHGYEALRDAEVDVVHDHTAVGPRYAHWFPRLPAVTTNHGPFDRRACALYGATARRVPVVAISAHQAATAPPGTVAAVIHHGIDTARIPVGTGDGGYALFLGRMHPDKGVDLAVAAARAAGMPLRIAAKMREPAERDYYRAVVAPLLGRDAEFVGEVTGRDKLALLGSAVCLLNPIRWAEPFGMVMIEALACGTPVVALDAGSVAEIVTDGETGFVCSSVTGVAAALGRVGELRRDRCRQEAERRFSAARMATDYLRVYQLALAARGAGGERAHPTGRAQPGRAGALPAG